MTPSADIARVAPDGGRPAPLEADAVIVGAGPVGLFQVFELGLLSIKAHVIDSLGHPGGQCAELYPDKPIYDIPAVPVCTGQELTDRLLKQIEPFGAQFHLGQEVSSVRRQADGRFWVQTSAGVQLLTKTLFIAGGVGSFQPRPLKVQGLDKFDGSQVLYRLNRQETLAGRHVVIVGDGNAALEGCLSLAQPGPHQAASVTLLHRRDSFRAAAATVARMRACCEQRAMQFLAGQIIGFDEHDGRLVAVHVFTALGETQVVPLDSLLVFMGLSPKLGPIADWGLALERKQLVVDTEKFQTSVPGIFAVGDINTYPGKRKLIVSGFHEATLAAFAAAPIVFPDRQVLLQYTTTSPKLHQLLGVEVAPLD